MKHLEDVSHFARWDESHEMDPGARLEQSSGLHMHAANQRDHMDRLLSHGRARVVVRLVVEEALAVFVVPVVAQQAVLLKPSVRPVPPASPCSPRGRRAPCAGDLRHVACHERSGATAPAARRLPDVRVE